MSEHKPIGRPPATEKSASVSTWIPHRDHDRLIELAKTREQSVSATVRQLLMYQLRKP